MPARKNPPALKLRKEKSGQEYWSIYYDRKFYATGLEKSQIDAAEEAMLNFINDRALANEPDALRATLGDVLLYYAEVKVKTDSKPKELIAQIERLVDFFGDEPLQGGAKASKCRAYAKTKGDSQVAARVELERLQAAINFWYKEHGLAGTKVSLWKPPKPRPRERYLTRGEMAKLLNTVLHHKEVQKGVQTEKNCWRHLSRFIVIGFYTGTRSTAMLNLKWERSPDHGWVDLENGLLYREGYKTERTSKRQPPVKIPRKLLLHLKRWYKMDAGQVEWVIHYQGRKLNSIKKAFRNAADHLGLTDVVPHTLRHTRATHLMQAGVPIWDAAGSLGMTTQQLEANYGHHHPDSQKASMNAY